MPELSTYIVVVSPEEVECSRYVCMYSSVMIHSRARRHGWWGLFASMVLLVKYGLIEESKISTPRGLEQLMKLQ